MAPATATPLLLGDAARIISERTGIHVEAWKLRRAFERGLQPAAQKVGRFRVVQEADIAAVIDGLRAAGYLPAEEVPAHAQ